MTDRFVPFDLYRPYSKLALQPDRRRNWATANNDLYCKFNSEL